MKKYISKIIVLFLIVIFLISTISAYAASGVKLQLYFSPGIMDDTTGEIVVDVNIKNFNIAVPKSAGKLCAIAFKLEFDEENFDIQTESKGVDVITDDTTLIKSKNDIETKNYDNGIVEFTYMDSTLENNLIGKDGTLFRFVIVSKNPRAFWNSDDKYCLSFFPGSIAMVAYDVDRSKVTTFRDYEGIDIEYGPYNKPPTLYEPTVPDVEEDTEDTPVVPDTDEPLDKNESSDNKTDVSVDNEKKEDNKDNESSNDSSSSFKPSGVPGTTTPVTSGGGSYKPINGTKVPANAEAYRYVVSFKADSTDIIVGSETKATDAKSYSQNGRMMVPMRYFAENVGMTVDWDGDYLIASAYGNFKSLKILEKDCIVYVNAVKVNPAIPPINLEGRFFISSDVIAALYPNAKIVETTDEITIYIP